MVATNQSLWVYIEHAGLVVKFVMLILVLASILSWTFIIQRGWLIRNAKALLNQFEEQFWSGQDLTRVYSQMERSSSPRLGLASIFSSGFKEFVRSEQQAQHQDIDSKECLDNVKRAMRIATAREQQQLEKHLPFLASVGSTSPYIGLFGTVWGIMTAFHALGQVQQASIAMVAPGISEALIATAMGLFAAIPAVLAYNRYSANVDTLLDSYETFQEEFISILKRRLGKGQTA